MKFLHCLLLFYLFMTQIVAEIDIEIWTPSFAYQSPSTTLAGNSPITGQVTADTPIENIKISLGTRKFHKEQTTSIYYQEGSEKKIASFHASANINANNNILTIFVSTISGEKLQQQYAIPASYNSIDIENFRLLKKITTKQNAITTMQISLDTDYLIAGGDDGYVKIFELPSLKEIQSLRHRDPIRKVILTSNNKELIVATKNGDVYIYEPFRGKELYHVHVNDSIESMTLAHGQKLLAIAGRTIQIWNLPERQKIRDFSLRLKRTTALQFANDERFLFSGDETGTILLWNVYNAAVRYSRSSGHENEIKHITLCPSYNFMYTTDYRGWLKWWKLILDPQNDAWNSQYHKFWEIRQGFIKGNVKGHKVNTKSNDIIHSIKYAPVYTIKNTSGDTDEPFNTLKNRNNSGQSVALQLNGTGEFLMTVLQEGEMKIYETATGLETYSTVLNNLLHSGAFADNAKYVVIGGGQGEIWIYGK
ncbi:MAG: hypothetical protein KBC30_01390 [Planctomycetes bacterium]|nr:hypothetical protein [Planctomycetota bacterium]